MARRLTSQQPLCAPELLSADAQPPIGCGVAVFDLDRTLLQGSSLMALGRAMARRGMVSRLRLVGALAQERRFRQRGLRDASIAGLRDGALRHVAGLDRSVLLERAREVGSALAHEVSPGAALVIRRHLAAGDSVVILSASPQELVEAVARGLGADCGIGTRAEVRNGRFTGELDGPFCYGPGKVGRLVAELGSQVLVNAAAYADSTSDLPLLESCCEPVAVNPDRQLLRVAEHRNWPVLRFH